MSVFKQKNAIGSTEFKGFEGIDATVPHKYVPAASDMVNFRVLEDGSLQKRCGFAPIASFSSKIRAIWSGTLEGKHHTFIIYGNQVVKIDPVSKSLVTIGNIDTSEDHVKFIYINSRLFIMDSSRFYNVTPDSLTIFEGYAPLYGKLWGIGKIGTVYEPLNLLTRHIRMSYRVDEKLIYLCVLHVVTSIDAVYIDGELLSDTSRYYFDSHLMSVCVLGLEIGQIVDLYLTIAPYYVDSSRICSCKQSVVYGGYTDSKLFLWDGKDEDVMYVSSTPSSTSMKASRAVYGNTMPLYIPEDSKFVMSKDGRRITAVCRHYNNLLIFTNEDAWMSKNSLESDNILDAVTVNSSHGCTSDSAVVMCGNDPVCVSNGSILKWVARTDELNECNAYSISSQIEPYLKSSFFTNAKILLNEALSELIFFDPTDADELLWIYNYKTSNWYKFDGIGAEEVFFCEGMLGFIKNNTVYLFDDELGHDVLSDGSKRKIVAFYESNPIDLNIGANKKRLLGMSLNANLYGKSITAEYVSDSKIISSLTLKSNTDSPVGFIKRLSSPRFCYVTLRLTSDADSPQRIYSSGIWAKL